MRLALITGCLACLLTPAVARAQRSTAAAGSAIYETYRFNDAESLQIESLSLMTLPMTWQAEVGRWRVRVLTAYARGSLERPDGTQSTVAGFTDTEVSAQFEMVRNFASVAALAVLPTGKEQLTFDQVFVAGAIASDLLPFRITNWGTGGGVGFNVTLTRPVAGFAAGLSAGYIVAQTFQPLSEEEFEYRPGNQFQLRAAFDHLIGRSGKASLLLGYERFAADRGDRQNLFQAGDRLQASVSLDFALGNSAAVAYAGWSHRGEGDFAAPQEFLPAQQVGFTGLAVRAPIGRAVLQPSAELRILDSDGTDRRGYNLGVGSALEIPARSFVLIPTVRARIGRVEASDAAETGFTGAELGLVLRIGAVTR